MPWSRITIVTPLPSTDCLGSTNAAKEGLFEPTTTSRNNVTTCFECLQVPLGTLGRLVVTLIPLTVVFVLVYVLAGTAGDSNRELTSTLPSVWI